MHYYEVTRYAPRMGDKCFEYDENRAGYAVPYKKVLGRTTVKESAIDCAEREIGELSAMVAEVNAYLKGEYDNAPEYLKGEYDDAPEYPECRVTVHQYTTVETMSDVSVVIYDKKVEYAL